MRSVAAMCVLGLGAGVAFVGPALPGKARAVAAGIAPRIVELNLTGADVRAAGSLLEPARATAPFSMVALTWPAGREIPQVSVRTRTDGVWSGWTHLHEDFDGPDPDSPESAGPPGRGPNSGTVPLWTGPAEGLQLRLDARPPALHPLALPTDLRLLLIDPGEDPSPAPAPMPDFSEAAADTGPPRIRTRADWRADERLREAPKYTGSIRAAFVHHTSETNYYTPAQVPKIIRGIYAFHTKGRGWSDIGYNFLVDKWGRVWEGRYGGVGRQVRGAHTGGFNVETVGIAVLGNFNNQRPKAATMEALARLINWKLDRADGFFGPSTRGYFVSQGGGTSRYKKGREAAFRRISGHRDAGRTSCPGEYLYDALPKLRKRVAALQKKGTVEYGRTRTLVGTGPAAVPLPPPAEAGPRPQPPAQGGGPSVSREGRAGPWERAYGPANPNPSPRSPWGNRDDVTRTGAGG
ncbi:MAG: peptidoglycan recognition protein family protein [Sporichthyaceae bacterium]